MTFVYPYILLTPLLIALLALSKKKESAALPYPDIGSLEALPTSLKLKLRKPLLLTLSAATVILLSIAAARPQKVKILDQSYRGRDIILALDISGSMKEADFKAGGRYISRLQAVKLVVAEFIKSRLGDRIGLVVFGSNAYLQSPLTLDHRLLVQLISLLQVGVAGDGTAIGEGLGVALKALQDIEADSKTVILLTDGSNNSGRVSPQQAASIATKLSVKVHTIGIGGDPKIMQRNQILLGRQLEFDENTLKEIAKISEGVYFNASNLEGLKEVYKEIDKLEKTESEEPQKKMVTELFPDFTLWALICFISYTILANSIFLKIP